MFLPCAKQILILYQGTLQATLNAMLKSIVFFLSGAFRKYPMKTNIKQ